METMTVLWNELFRPLIVLAIVVAVISVVTWHFSRPKPKLNIAPPACPECLARVHHTKHGGQGGN